MDDKKKTAKKTENSNGFNLRSPEYYFNRELSFIEFNKRVLYEAEDRRHPLLERLKFAAIFSSNLDEFFMIRVAGLKGQKSADVVDLSYDGKTPGEQLVEIRKRLEPLYERQQILLNGDIFPELQKHDIVIHYLEELDDDDMKYMEQYFYDSILPVLTPLSLGPANPFPRLINRSLNVAFVLKDKTKKITEQRVAFVQVPTVLPRFIRLSRKKGHHFVLIEQIIKSFASILFPGLEVVATNTFRVTRDADIEIAEDEADDLLFEIAEQIKQRRWGRVAVRLEVSANMPDYLVNLLMNSLDLEPNDVYIHDRPINLPDFMELAKIELRELKDKPFATRTPRELVSDTTSIFDAIKQHDTIVHHPYDSFTNSTLHFVREASEDPDVLAIKITLYRTGMNSPVVAALKKAAENGKYITAFVELKARFDEENNIVWAKELERYGVHVVYGFPGFKTHCKICIVVRREMGKLKTYMHLSTGNYNQSTARLYTDIGFFTANDEFGLDAAHLFNFLTGYSYQKNWKHFSVAPINLRERIMGMIEREAELHTEDNPGMIIAKMNSIAHRDVIPALYKASQKGVKIKLLVRGICCLRPGIKGISDNIEVRSILGRFLEHSRIFYFRNGGDEEFYLSSADWMSRNLNNRVELMFPVNEPELRQQIWEILNIYWSDNTKSWRLLTNGNYEKVKPGNGAKLLSAQDYFLSQTQMHRTRVI